jgi:hypothetical protein
MHGRSIARMLRITIQDGPEALTFQVEGKLIGQWAKITGKSSTPPSRPLYCTGRPKNSALLLDLTAWRRWQASKKTVPGTQAQLQTGNIWAL